MSDKDLIAKRVAQELRGGNLVNLGIGLPTLVAKYLPPGIDVYFQSENGLIGLAPLPEAGMADEYLTDAGGNYVGAIPAACSLDSALSFGIIRGGHLDVTVLGGLEVDQRGYLANWAIPGKMIPGMGGAMDLVMGARRVIIAMTHSAKGKSKIVRQCSASLTAIRRVDLVVTNMAVIEPTAEGLVLRETAPGVTPRAVIAATEADLITPKTIPEMHFDA